MEIKARFDHYNCNVYDLDRSLEFYYKALGFSVHHQVRAEDGSYLITYLTDSSSTFFLELTWLNDWGKPYEMGDNEQHLCVRVDGDYDKIRQFHRENGWICYENHEMDLYFIEDPDGYWIEILPANRK